MTKEEAAQTPSGTLLVTPFVSRGVVMFVKLWGGTIQVEFLHNHAGHKAGGCGFYPAHELMTLLEYSEPCKDGEGHVSHDFLGGYCRKCELSEAAVDYLKGLGK